jgi:hypothetical protein
MGLAGVEEGAAAVDEAHEVEVTSTLGAAQRRRFYARGCRLHRPEDEVLLALHGDEPAESLEVLARAGAQEAVVAELLEAAGQDVLEEAAQKLRGSKRMRRQRRESLFR